ncbi:MAG: UvrD-helicase domain-containing protein, partial [Acidobacteria bacterium]|nr:UvrD-helicase domain-containing protein [Acidobacteriota bacterium]
MSPGAPSDDAVLAAALESDRAARRLAQSEFERPLVLEAGAGTGKTTTLVARILAWCLGPGWEKNRALLAERAASRGNDPPSPEQVAAATLQRVVAITFTEAAAAEMAGRVGLELAVVAGGSTPVWLAAELLPEADERTRRARALAGTLDRLVVRTIHAFCRGLLADHPLDAGLHPEIQVDADGRLAEQAAREVITAHLAAGYGEPGDPAFLALAAEGYGPEALATTLTTLVSQGARPEDFDEDPLSADRVAELQKRVEAALEPAARTAAPLAAIGKRSTKTLAAVAALETTSRVLAAADARISPVEDLERLCQTVSTSWNEAAFERLRDWAKGSVNPSEAKLLDDPGGLVQAATGLAPLLRHLLSLAPRRLADARRVLVPLLAEVRHQLRTRGVMTFPDLLLEARDLLARRPGVRRRIQRGIDQLLVDEFQDTDDLQTELLGLLALEGTDDLRPALFLVGDPKQSIYGWRSADLAAYDAFLDRVRDANGRVEILAENFRSVPAILDEVARSVAPVMVEQKGLQPAFQPLVACAARAEDPGFAEDPWATVEHWVTWRAEDQAAGAPGGATTRAADSVVLEAEALARDLLRLRRQHDVAWSSVGLLLRGTGDLDDYLEALRRAGIPFAVGRDRHYYRRREIIEAAALVRVVIDPGDPVALLTVLRSPMVGVPDAALIPLWSRGFPRLVAELRLEELERVVDAAAATLPAGVPGLERLAGWPRALLAALHRLAELRASFR